MFTRNENLEVVFGEVKVVEVAVKGKLPFLLFTQTTCLQCMEHNPSVHYDLLVLKEGRK